MSLGNCVFHAGHTGGGAISVRGVFGAIYTVTIAFDFYGVVPGLSLGRLGTLLFLCALLLSIRLEKQVLHPAPVLVFFLLFSCLVSMFLSPFPGNSAATLLSIGMNALIVLLASVSTFSRKDLYLITAGMLFGSLLLMLLMFTSPGSVGTEWVTERTVVSIAGYQQDPNELCAYFLFPIAFFSYYGFRDNRFSFLLIMGLSIYCVILTGSRGGLLSAACAILVSLFLGLKNSKRRLMYVVIGLSVIIAGILLFDDLLRYLPPSVAERFELSEIMGGTASVRTQAWKDVLSSFVSSDVARAFFGHGFRATTLVTQTAIVAHNTFIEMLYCCGIVGLFCFAGLIVKSIFDSIQLNLMAVCSALIACAVLLNTITDPSSKALWGLLALVVLWGNENKTGEIR